LNFRPINRFSLFQFDFRASFDAFTIVIFNLFTKESSSSNRSQSLLLVCHVIKRYHRHHSRRISSADIIVISTIIIIIVVTDTCFIDRILCCQFARPFCALVSTRKRKLIITTNYEFSQSKLQKANIRNQPPIDLLSSDSLSFDLNTDTKSISSSTSSLYSPSSFVSKCGRSSCSD
jgi:hypothetical protein